MTKEYAAKVTKALNDIEDFEILFDEIETAVQHTEGDFDDFYYNQIFSDKIMYFELQYLCYIFQVFIFSINFY